MLLRCSHGYISASAHRYQHAVQVSVLLLVPVSVGAAQQLLEPPQARNPEDGEAALAAEGLEQGEVDLQGHVVRIVGRQDAEDHAVGIPGEATGSGSGTVLRDGRGPNVRTSSLLLTRSGASPIRRCRRSGSLVSEPLLGAPPGPDPQHASCTGKNTQSDVCI